MIFAALVALAVGAGTATGVLDGTERPGPSAVGTTMDPPEQGKPVLPDRVPEAALEAFAFLRREPGASDRLSEEMVERLKTPGINARLARRVADGSTLQAQLWVAPGERGTMCTFDGTGSGGCLYAEDFVRRGTVSVDECPIGMPDQAILLTGLVPDGVEEVELVRPDRTVAVAVQGNLWRYESTRDAATRPTRVTWTRDGEERVGRVPYSPDVLVPCKD